MSDIEQRIRKFADGGRIICTMSGSLDLLEIADRIAALERENATLRLAIRQAERRFIEVEQDAERGRFFVKNAMWIRREDEDRHALMAIRVPYETDLSCYAYRAAAVDAEIAAARKDGKK